MTDINLNFGRAESTRPAMHKLVLAAGWLLFALLMLPQAVTAEVFQPVQIFLPGNLQGRLSELTPDLTFNRSDGWKIPDTIDAFRKDGSRHQVVFAPGNDSDICAPLSFFDNGEFERHLIERCRPDAAGISPADLETFNNSRLTNSIRQRVFTNLDSGPGTQLFSPFMVKKHNKTSIWFFNFIDPLFCDGLSATMFGAANLEDPARALRRLNPDFGNSDISVSIVYAGPNATDNLINELKTRSGYHLIVHMPFREQAAFYSNYSPEQDKNIFKMSLKPGHQYLPLINIFTRSNGFPRLTLRMLPLAKSRSLNAKHWHNDAMNQIKSALFETVRVVTTTTGPSTAARQFSLQAQAHMLRISTASELAIVIPPEARHLNDNVISVANILVSIPNDRIHRFRLSGDELMRLGEQLIRQHGINALAFSGCEFSCLGGQIRDFKVASQAVEPRRMYTVVSTLKTLNDLTLKKFLADRTIESYDGNSVWNCWKNTLKTINISDNNLFE